MDWCRRPILLAAAVLSVLAVSCANPPRFVKRNWMLAKFLYRPYGMPYIGSKRFVFTVKADWKGPEPVTGGVQYIAPHERARLSIAWHPDGSEGWIDPVVLKRRMREQGSTEDRHALIDIEVSTRPAIMARSTEHHYDPEYILGAKKDVVRRESIMVPESDGYFFIEFEAEEKYYIEYLKVFHRFLDSLELSSTEEIEAMRYGGRRKR